MPEKSSLLSLAHFIPACFSIGQLTLLVSRDRRCWGEWWALVNEVRASAAVAGGLDKTGLPTPDRQTGRAAHGETRQSAPTSLLDDVEQDAFLPG